MRDLRSEVISAFHPSPDKVTDDLVISRQTATELIRPDVQDLDVVDKPDQDENSPLRQPIRTPRDVRDQETDVAMSQSSWTSSEDTSAEDSCTGEEHDQELFLEAYTAFTTKSDKVGSVDSLRRWFSSVERLPDSWPLARLSITLDGLTSQLSKVVMSATMEIIASCRDPDYGLPSVTQLAKASSCSPLVLLGKSLSASVLQIWFPAHWAVRVETRLSSLGGTTSEYRAEHTQTLVPNVRCNIKLPGQSIDVEHLLQRFPTVLRGIIQGVFRQQAGGAWFPCRDLKLAITVLMPQSSEPHHWFGAVFFFFSSLAERAITAVPVTALPYEAIVTSSAMPRFHQAETQQKNTKPTATKQKTNNATPTTPKPKTKHLSGNRVAYFCTTYN